MVKEDILLLLDSLGKKYHINSNLSFIQTQCFFSWNHKRGDKSPSFSIKIVENGKSDCKCFTCHHNYISLLDSISLLNKYENNKYSKLLEFVLNKEELTLNNRLTFALKKIEKKTEDFKIKKEVKEDKREVFFSEEQFLEYPKEYVQELVSRGVGYCAFNFWEIAFDKKHNRIIFPMRKEKTNELIGLSGRLLNFTKESKYPKYYHYNHFNKSHFFYGEHLFSEKTKKIVLVEGFFDVIILWQTFKDFTDEYIFLGVLGTYLSNIQLFRIREKGLPVYLMFDSDKAGKDCERHTQKELKGHVPIYTVNLPEGKDPGDLRDYPNLLISSIENASFCV